MKHRRCETCDGPCTVAETWERTLRSWAKLLKRWPNAVFYHVDGGENSSSVAASE